METEWIPIVLFITGGTVLSFYFYYNYRARAGFQETVRAALDKGAELSPEVIEQLSRHSVARTSDFRRGVLLIALGIGISIFALISQSGDRDLVGISVLPLMLGLGYLVVWKLNPDRA